MQKNISVYVLAESAQPMTLDEFWDLIDQVNAIHATENLPKDDALGQLLAPRPALEVASYLSTFRALSDQLNNDQAYAVLGGSDDGFMDGRAWAISMGRAYYEQLLNTPETLRGTATEEFEEFSYVPTDATEDGPRRDQHLAAGLARLEAAALRAQTPEPQANPNGPSLRV